jgi:hypothetical protein
MYTGVKEEMSLLTRSDFDGLVSAVLLKEVGIMDEWSSQTPRMCRTVRFKSRRMTSW